jgi:hypothetical protein
MVGIADFLALFRLCNQASGGSARFARDLRPRKHSSDLFPALARIEARNARGDALAGPDVAFDDSIMAAGARGYLRRMSDGKHLRPRGEASEALTHGVRDRAADACVDFVEHKGRRCAAIRKAYLDRQEKAREFAA